MKPKIMFVIDNPYRELWGISSITAFLNKHGISTIICSKMNHVLCWEVHRPEAVVLPRVTYDMADFVQKIEKYSWIFLIPSEHGSGFQQKVLMNVAIRKPDGTTGGKQATDLVDMAFVGGSNQYQWLKDANIFDDERMIISGTLNSDHWCLKRFEKASQVKSNRFGIATTNKALFFGVPVDSVVDLLNRHRPGDWKESIWRVDFAAYEFAHMLILGQVVQELIKQGLFVSFRPHPHEYVPQWKGYIKSLGNKAELNRFLTIDSWLNSVSYVLASYSTVSIDAIAHGLPSFSLHNIVPTRYYEALPSMKRPLLAPYSWAPSSIEEFVDLVKKAQAGDLPLSPKFDEAQKFMMDNFHFPRNKFASEIIAEKIIEKVDCAKSPALKKAKIDVPSRLFNGPLKLLLKLPGLKSLVIYLTYLRTFLVSARRGNLYFPFSIKQKKGASSFANRILSCGHPE